MLALSSRQKDHLKPAIGYSITCCRGCFAADVHLSYAFHDTLTGAQATKGCTVAHSSYSYDIYKGVPNDYLDMQKSSFYSSSAKKNKYAASGATPHIHCLFKKYALHFKLLLRCMCTVITFCPCPAGLAGTHTPAPPRPLTSARWVQSSSKNRLAASCSACCTISDRLL